MARDLHLEMAVDRAGGCWVSPLMALAVALAATRLDRRRSRPILAGLTTGHPELALAQACWLTLAAAMQPDDGGRDGMSLEFSPS